jgi:hypothetical protein
MNFRIADTFTNSGQITGELRLIGELVVYK